MPLTLKNINVGSGSAGTDAIAVAGSLFDRATKNFVGAAENIQEDRAAAERKDIDANTRQLLSELRNVRPEDATDYQATLPESAERRFGSQFDAGKLDTALAGLPGAARERVTSEQDFAENQALRKLQPGAKIGPDASVTDIVGAKAEIDAEVADLPFLKQEEARQALLKSRGINDNRLIEQLLDEMPADATQEQALQAAQDLGVSSDKFLNVLTSQREATGEAALTRAEAAERAARAQKELDLEFKKRGSKEAPVADKELVAQIQKDLVPLMGERWLDFGSKDVEHLNNIVPAVLAAGVTREEILQVAGEYGKSGFTGNPELDKIKKRLLTLVNRNAEAGDLPALSLEVARNYLKE